MAEKLSNTEIVKFMNYTTTYGADKINDEITNYLSGFSTASQSIKNMEKTVDPTTLANLSKATSKDQLIATAMKCLRSIDSRLADLAQKALDDYMITKDITLDQRATNSHAKCEKDGDRLNLHIVATPDINGVVAIGQNLVNASLYKEYYDNQKAEDKSRDNLSIQCANKFVGYMMVDTIARKLKLSPEQKTAMQWELLNDTHQSIETLETAQKLFGGVLKDNPEIFKANMQGSFSADAFNMAMEGYVDSTTSKEGVNDFIRDVADEGKTPHFLAGNILSDLSALDLREKYYENPDITIGKILDGARNNKKLSELTSKTNAEIINQTPAQIKDLNIEKYKDIDPNRPLSEQLLDLSNEQVRQMEMLRKNIK